jgi:hypothetical protein
MDNDDSLFAQMLREPWFRDNKVPEKFSCRERWIEIFNGTIV